MCALARKCKCAGVRARVHWCASANVLAIANMLACECECDRKQVQRGGHATAVWCAGMVVLGWWCVGMYSTVGMLTGVGSVCGWKCSQLSRMRLLLSSANACHPMGAQRDVLTCGRYGVCLWHLWPLVVAWHASFQSVQFSVRSDNTAALLASVSFCLKVSFRFLFLIESLIDSSCS